MKNTTLPMGLAGKTTHRAPSNLAIIKYWGKHGVQLPRNPSISFTLNNAFTETTIHYEVKAKANDHIDLDFYFEGQKNDAFRNKQIKFLTSIIDIFPFLEQTALRIESRNSFPHSAGIASSASSMAALALGLCAVEKAIYGEVTLNCRETFFADELQKASYVARLGSGSACRSVYPTMAVWGKTDEIPHASDDFAVAFEPHEIFKTYHDDILIVGGGEKSVSSRMGHGLMDGNPFAPMRYAQANERMNIVLAALKAGDLETFGQIAEDEAMTLHALMMTCSPSFTLLRPNTLKIIELLRGYRAQTKHPVFFSLDAGPNPHLLYPHYLQSEIQNFIRAELANYCENGRWIADEVGNFQ